jgi:hypothetical protein
VESSMVASSLAGRWSLAQARERTACLGLALQTVAQSAAEVDDVPLPHDLPPVYCLAGDSSLLVFLALS